MPGYFDVPVDPTQIMPADMADFWSKQAVMKFASETARDTALPASRVRQGMLAYLDDSQTLMVYSGTTWTRLAFGAYTTGGVANWNDATNTKAGFAPTLLTGNATNGPAPTGLGAGVYFHALNVEYNTKDGTGQLTQYAIPYSTGYGNIGMFIRGRYLGTWGAWQLVGAEDAGEAIPFTANWSNYDSANWANGRVKRNGNRVSLQGLIKHGVAGGIVASTIGTLSAGYRPLKAHMFGCLAVRSDGAKIIYRVDIYTTGVIYVNDVYVGGDGTNAWLNLDGIGFDVPN